MHGSHRLPNLGFRAGTASDQPVPRRAFLSPNSNRKGKACWSDVQRVVISLTSGFIVLTRTTQSSKQSDFSKVLTVIPRKGEELWDEC